MPIAPADAELIDEPVLRTKPFFKKGADPDLYWPGVVGSTYAISNQKRLLANAMPALTLPAGANMLRTATIPQRSNFDMQAVFKNGWPSSRADSTNWRHSDLKDVSYPFVHKLFDTFVSLGGLK